MDTLLDRDRAAEPGEPGARAAGVEVPGTEQAEDGPPRFAPGSELAGRYRIEGELGRGGMGRVMAALDLTLGRRVAVKMISAEIPSRDLLERFEREARAASALDHPNVLVVHDVLVEGGRPCIVTELLTGRSLRDLLREGPPGLDRSLALASQLASALSAAHAKGIVHRDLKPENLFVGPGDRLKVLDFGIAKLSEAGPQQTASGAVIGTPGYMAPEQARGLPADARADVFSFGSILHELLTGKRAFPGATALEAAWAVLNFEPAPLPREVPGWLAGLVHRCLEKDPAKRFPDGRALLEVLEGPEAPAAQAIRKRLARAAASKRLRKRVTVTSAVLLAGSLALLGFVRSRACGGEPARIRIAVADFANETGDQDLAGLSGLLATSLDQSKHLAVVTRSSMFQALAEMGKPRVEVIDEPLGREVARHASLDALVLASVHRFGALYTIDVKVLDPRQDRYLVTSREETREKEGVPAAIDRISAKVRLGLRETATEVAASVPVATVTTASLEAYRLLFEGDHLWIDTPDPNNVETIKKYREALRVDPGFALAHLRLAGIGEGSQELEQALKDPARLPENELCSARALELSYRDRQAESASAYRECATRYPNDLLAARGAAWTSLVAGELEEAATWFERRRLPENEEVERMLRQIWALHGRRDHALADARQRVGALHSKVAYQGLAYAQAGLGDLGAARQALEEAERLFPDAGFPLLIGVQVEASAAEPDRAEALLERFLKQLDAGARKHGLDVKAVQNPHRALFDFFRGRYRKGIARQDEMAAAALLQGDKVSAAAALLGKGDALAAAGDRPGAERAWRETLGLAPQAEWILAQAYTALGDPDGLRRLLADRKLPRPEVALEKLPWTLRIAAAEARRDRRPGDEAAALERLSQTDPLGLDGLLWQRPWPGNGGRLYLDAGEPGKARAILARTVRILPARSKEALFQVSKLAHDTHSLGRAYEQLGDKQAALDAYRRALRMWSDADPDLPDLIDARSRVAALEAGR